MATEWTEGYPKERGLYKCRVDGKEQVLVLHYCANNCRYWWSDVAGYDVVGHKIEFSGVKLTADDI